MLLESELLCICSCTQVHDTIKSACLLLQVMQQCMCRQALKQGRCQDLAELMNENFRLRCQMFGEEVIGARNIQMVSLARSVGGDTLWAWETCLA